MTFTSVQSDTLAPPAEQTTQAVSRALDPYVVALQGVLTDDFVGVYLHGSIVLGAYRPGLSDVDIAVLHRRNLTDDQRQALADVHGRLAPRNPSPADLDVSFVPLRWVGGDADRSLACFRGGRFRPRGGADVNPVVWHILRTKGFTVYGPPAAALVPTVEPAALTAAMRRNLAFLARRMPRYVLGGTASQIFGVLTLCRVLHTLDTSELTTKAGAAAWALHRVDRRWRRLIERGLARYESGEVSSRDWLLTSLAIPFCAHVTSIAKGWGTSC